MLAVFLLLGTVSPARSQIFGYDDIECSSNPSHYSYYIPANIACCDNIVLTRYLRLCCTNSAAGEYPASCTR